MNLIVVSGSPGTGKSTVSRRLAGRLGFKLIDLNRWLLSEGLILGFDRDTGSYEVDLESARVKLLDEVGESTVVEGHLSHLVVPPSSDAMIFILRCHPVILARRLSLLGYGEAKIAENVEAELLSVCLSEAVEIHGLHRVHEVDNSCRTVDSAVEEITSVLSGRCKPRCGVVDWFSRLQEEGILEKVLLAVESRSLTPLEGIL